MPCQLAIYKRKDDIKFINFLADIYQPVVHLINLNLSKLLQSSLELSPILVCHPMSHFLNLIIEILKAIKHLPHLIHELLGDPRRLPSPLRIGLLKHKLVEDWLKAFHGCLKQGLIFLDAEKVLRASEVKVIRNGWRWLVFDSINEG